MPETFTVHNPLDTPQEFTIHHHHGGPGFGPSAETFTVPPHASLELPLHFFRAIFVVRCSVQSCRELGFCCKAHKGEILGGKAPRLIYEAIAA